MSEVVSLEESQLLPGVRVVELSSSVAGAYAGRLLASMGAHVTRVAHPTESATSSDVTELLEGWLHKDKVIIERGDSIEAALAAASLVVIEIDPGDRDFRKFAENVSARAVAMAHRPVVVLLRHSVQNGQAIAGTSMTVSAWSGMSWAMGNAGSAPLTLPFDLGGYEGGIHACAAGLAALLAAPENVALRSVDVSSRDVMAYFTGMITANFIPYERQWTREGARPPGSAGVYPASIFPCRDGHVVLMCRSQKEWDVFVAGMGSPEWAMDPRFRDPRVVARLYADEVDQYLTPWILRHTQQELLEFGTRLGLPIAPVRSMKEAIDEPQLAHRGYLETLPGTNYRVPRNPWRLTELAAEPDNSTRAWPLEPATSNSTGSLLKGLRVLDLSWVWSGPLVTSVLVDLGAEVLKIEHTDNMDSSRTRGRARRNGVEVDGPEHEATPYFNQMNHGKLSITMNLKEARAREIILDLAQHCDVVVENMRPGAMGRLGLTFEELASRNPGIVLLSMSMAGQTGPLSGMKGYAGIMAAMSGLESLIGYDEHNIVGSLAPALGDPNASGHALSALLAALYRRRETGKGTWIDLSQTEALMNVLAGPILATQRNGSVLPPANRHPLYSPNGHFACSGDDAWIAIAVRSDEEWAQLVELAVDSELGSQNEWKAVEGRRRDVESVEQALSDWVCTQNRDDLVSALLERGIAAAPVASYHDLIAAEWKSERGLTTTVTHPYLGETEIFVVPWNFGDSKRAASAAAPLLGSSTETVLDDLLGMSGDTVRQLQRDRVLY